MVIERFVQPREIVNSNIGIMVMVVAMIMTLLLVGFQVYVVRKTNSIAISADSLHYRADLLVNITVIISLLCLLLLYSKKNLKYR